MKRFYFLIAITFVYTVVGCQSLEKRETWYDLNKTQLHETYEVKTEPPYVKHGHYQKYSKTGQLLIDCFYENNQQHGQFFSYYEDGQLRYEGVYDEGKEDGKHIQYYPNGQIHRLVNYYQGQPHGELGDYQENGKPINKGIMEYGVPIFYQKYYSNGQLQEENNYLDGELNGPFQSFYENGQQESKGVFLAGQKHGRFEFFYPNGQMKEQADYKNGELHGIYNTYSDNGFPSKQFLFEKGLQHGLCTGFNKQGKKFFTETYEYGKIKQTQIFSREIDGLAISLTHDTQTEKPLSGNIHCQGHSFCQASEYLYFEDYQLNSKWLPIASQEGINVHIQLGRDLRSQDFKITLRVGTVNDSEQSTYVTCSQWLVLGEDPENIPPLEFGESSYIQGRPLQKQITLTYTEAINYGGFLAQSIIVRPLSSGNCDNELRMLKIMGPANQLPKRLAITSEQAQLLQQVLTLITF